MVCLIKIWYSDFRLFYNLFKSSLIIGIIFHNKRNALVMMFSKIDRMINCHGILSMNKYFTMKEFRNIFEKHHMFRQQRRYVRCEKESIKLFVITAPFINNFKYVHDGVSQRITGGSCVRSHASKD